jgi:ADP-ribose pyrophosphatase
MHQSDETRGREVLARGRFIQLVREDGWEFADRPAVTGIVTVVAVTDDGKLVLTEQYRRPIRRRVIELPAGLAGDVPGAATEEPAAAAARELEEGTGYRAERLEYLTAGPPSAGLSTEVVTFFRATGLRKVGPGGGDEHEEIEVHEVPLASAAAWLQEQAGRGRLIDPKVYAGLYFAVQPH